MSFLRVKNDFEWVLKIFWKLVGLLMWLLIKLFLTWIIIKLTSMIVDIRGLRRGSSAMTGAVKEASKSYHDTYHYEATKYSNLGWWVYGA